MPGLAVSVAVKRLSHIDRTIVPMQVHAMEHVQRRPAAVRDVLVIVEDDTLRDVIAAHLRHLGHLVLAAGHASEACRLFSQVRPDLVLLDGDGPAARSPELLRSLGDAVDAVPLVLLQSAAHPSSALLSPSLRVDKPYRPQALAEAVHRLLQVQAQTQRAALPSAGRVRAGRLELDFERRAVTVIGRHPGQWVDLAPTELRLLQHLMQMPERTHARGEIVEAVWGAGADVDERTVDQYVKRLRVALEPLGAEASVRTVRGLGYRVDPAALDANT